MDFGPIDSLPDFPDFGLDTRASRDLLGSFIYRVLSLSEFNLKWAIQARLSIFEPSVSAFEESLSTQLHRIVSDLGLSSDIMEALPFSSAPPPSVFLPSSGADDVNIPFFAGFIMLWALCCRLADADVPSLLLPPLYSSSSSSSLSPPVELLSPMGSPPASGSLTGPVSSLVPPSPALPLADSSAVALLLSQFSSLAAQVDSLSSTLAAVQASHLPSHHSSLSPPPASSLGPIGSAIPYPPVLSSPPGSLSSEPIDLSFSSDSPGFSSGLPGFCSPGLSLSPADANKLIVADSCITSRLTMQQLADGLVTGILLCSPTGGHVRVTRLAKGTGASFSVVNAAHDHPGPGPQTFSSATPNLWPQPRSELALLQQEHSHMLANNLRRRQTDTQDPLVLAAILQANVLATQTTHKFHQRAVELADHVCSGSSSMVHVTTWAWILFFLYKLWNLAWALEDLSPLGVHGFLRPRLPIDSGLQPKYSTRRPPYEDVARATLLFLRELSADRSPHVFLLHL